MNVLSLLDKAVIFAVQAHSGMVRKSTDTPFIVHPIEAAAIVATMTNDVEVMAAAVLHDTVEDTLTSAEDIRHACLVLQVNWVGALRAGAI